jgi:hypothetical protein
VFSKLIITEIVSAANELDMTTIPPEKRMTRPFVCTCEASHKGRPDDVTAGCGRWWLASVVKADDDSYKLVPAVDDSLVFAAKALDDAATGEVAAVRTSAEKWLPGVAAIYGLFGLASLVIGKDSLEKIPVEGRQAIWVLVALGLIVTAAAIYFGYRAAFGWFSVQDVHDDVKLAAWYRARRNAITQAPAHLRTALGLAGVSVAILFIAVSILWFVPPKSPPSPIGEVTYREDGTALPSTVCGPFKSGTGRAIVVQSTIGSATQPVTIDLDWVDSITPKDKC